MAKEETNKWTRERGFFELHGGELVMLGTALFFLVLFVGGIAVVVFQPKVPGLSQLYEAPPPPPPGRDQKLNLAPGEQEILLFPTKPKTPAAGQKPPPPQQNR